MSQTLREWIRESETELNCYAICSDTKVGKHNEEDPTTPDDLVIPATTSGKELARSFAATLKTRMTVVFSTYQSIDAIHEAQKKGVPEFDLIICDEAHRTTGAQLESKEESAFVRVHDNKFIQAKKRLYMTATPRLYSSEAKKKTVEEDVVVWSMDDEKYFGPELYRLGFSEAVKRDLLSDYKVVVLAVNEEYVSKAFQRQIGQNELSLDDISKIIGCWNGLSRKFNSDSNATSKKHVVPMKRAVAFASRIKDSIKFKDQFSTIIGEYRKVSSDDNALICTVHHVDGKQNALERNEKLEWLKAETGKKNECRILSNAKCLSEGVDVPSLDAVMFLNPRKSQVDIVQSVGRVMRKAESKEYGYIVLPIAIPLDKTPEKALDDNERYRIVWDVLQALRAHDDRFNIIINQMELNDSPPDRIVIGTIGFDTEDDPTKATEEKVVQQLFSFDYIEELKNAIYGKIVQKCGEKRYWEDWAKDVANIAIRHIEKIKELLVFEEHNLQFESFLAGLRLDLNPSLTEDEAIEMLSQHIITKPVFDALFGDSEFTQNNPVSQAMEKMVGLLEDATIENDIRSLDSFYQSVRMRAAGIDNAVGRQKIIIELYDKFFQTAFPMMAERLGIVYTPIPVVDFILNSVDAVLRSEFNLGIGSKDVHVLDPFTGTGTFIVRLLQSGLIEPENLKRKYLEELHANEIALMAYYIAAVNIEQIFHYEAKQSTKHSRKDLDYLRFPGIVFTDTYLMTENEDKFNEFNLFDNLGRIKRQRSTPIRVIIGNPPYSAGQKSENDNNQNQKYPQLDDKIRTTYADASTATNKNSLYDSYVRAIRWATDRIGNKGIIGFVSNGSYIDGNAMDGLRKCFANEFTDIYVFNCRGNQRTSGELSRKEGGKIFGSGSRAPIAITIFIKNPKKTGMPATIHYYDIGDYKTREEKLAILRQFKSIENVPWQIITPNAKNDWINQRREDFDTLLLLGDKDGNETTAFDLFSRGLETARDAWVYNFSKKKLKQNISRMIDFYNEQVEKYQEKKRYFPDTVIDDIIDTDPTKISWSRSLKNNLANGRKFSLKSSAMTEACYRPFCKVKAYFNRDVNNVIGPLSKFFPEPGIENMAICVEAPGGKVNFSTLITNILPDLHLFGVSQCFPYYVYEPVESKNGTFLDATADGERIGNYIRRENITDAALAKFREHYKDSKISKRDIFWCIYGILNCRSYQERFAAELKKQLPRVPFAADFWGFAKAGEKLADLHLNYETLKPYKLKEIVTSKISYHLTGMKFPSKTDKTKIIYNASLTLDGIPPETYKYVVNGKSALEWIMERYQITTHKDSGITNDPNDWATETSNESYIVELVKRIVTLSVESVKIIEGLPDIDISYSMKRLENLEDGWMDGEGKSLPKDGLQWFTNQFNNFFHNAPMPLVYPTHEGGLSLEWKIKRYDISLEVDMENHSGYWHSFHLDKKKTVERDIDLTDAAQWEWIIEQLHSVKGGHQ
jgi:predicted helicase